jgi:hypothetical protein
LSFALSGATRHDVTLGCTSVRCVMLRVGAAQQHRHCLVRQTLVLVCSGCCASDVPIVSSSRTCGRVVKAIASGVIHESGKGSNPFGFNCDSFCPAGTDHKSVLATAFIVKASLITCTCIVFLIAVWDCSCVSERELERGDAAGQCAQHTLSLQAWTKVVVP